MSLKPLDLARDTTVSERKKESIEISAGKGFSKQETLTEFGKSIGACVDGCGGSRPTLIIGTTWVGDLVESPIIPRQKLGHVIWQLSK